MADTFQIVVAAISVADVGLRLSLALAKFHSEAKQADSTAARLDGKVNNLRSVIESVRTSFELKIGQNNRPWDSEEQRLLSLIRRVLDDCLRTLRAFARELEGIHGERTLEKLRRTRLALRLHQINPVVARHGISALRESIANGDACLLQRSQSVQPLQNNRESFCGRPSVSSASNALDEDRITDDDPNSEEETCTLQNLRESLRLGRSVLERRTPSSAGSQNGPLARQRHDSLAHSGEGANSVELVTSAREADHTSSELASDHALDSDENTPLEVLSPLIEKLSRLVKSEMHAKGYSQAEMHQLEKIEYLKERKAMHNVMYNHLEEQRILAYICLLECKYEEADKIEIEIRRRSSAVSMSGKVLAPQVEQYRLLDDPRGSAEFNHKFAKSRLERYEQSESPKLLVEAADFAKRAVHLFRTTLTGRDIQDPRCQEMVRLLGQILELRGKNAEAEIYMNMYLNTDATRRLPQSPSTPIATSSEQALSLFPVNSADHVDSCDSNDTTALVKAVKTGQIATVHWLLQQGANAELECQGKIPLLHAVDCDEPTLVRILHHYRPHINLEVRDAHDRTALAIAAQKGSCEMIKALLDAGSSIETKSQKGVTPLMDAARHGRPDAVVVLLAKGSDYLVQDGSGESVLHYAVHGPDGVGNVQETIQQLINVGVDVNSRNRSGETPLLSATKQQKIAAINTLLSNQADANRPDIQGNTCLSIAVEDGVQELVQRFISEGAIYGRKIPSDVSPNIRNMLKAQAAEQSADQAREQSSSGSRRTMSRWSGLLSRV